jgi:rare lipoprotein A
MRLRRNESLLILPLLLAACGGKPDGPRVAAAPPPPKLAAAPAPAAPKPAPPVKIGKPYQVFGKFYYPSDDRGYDQKGIASWYGPGFHALNTANGERYDQDDLTAAHKTLPMPSWVEVENLDNGRKLVVRINDRGPFVDGRIIDLSRRAAQLLGVAGPGTARVRVRRVFPDGAPPPAVAPPPVIIASAPPSPAAVRGGHFIQVAALGDPGRIAWLKGYLSAFGPVLTEAAPGGLTRVRLGPYETVDKARPVLAQLRSAGYSEARLIPPPTTAR